MTKPITKRFIRRRVAAKSFAFSALCLGASLTAALAYPAESHGMMQFWCGSISVVTFCGFIATAIGGFVALMDGEWQPE